MVDKVKSMTVRHLAKTLTVKSASNLTPNMRRITLRGDAVGSFPRDAEGSYVKLLFGQVGRDKPITRTYTIAKHRIDQHEIDIDFMLHGIDGAMPHGVASLWSMKAQPGDEISLAGPGSATFINTDADVFLMAADMTALPALAANLKKLPADAIGYVFVEILSEADKQTLEKPEGVEIVWVINSTPGSDASPLFHSIEQASLPNGRLSVWVACEFKTMKKIRSYLKTSLEVEKSRLYVSSYWKRGDAEEAHKVAKKEDARNLQ